VLLVAKKRVDGETEDEPDKANPTTEGLGNNNRQPDKKCGSESQHSGYGNFFVAHFDVQA